MINTFNKFTSFKSFIEPFIKSNSNGSASSVYLYYYVHEKNNINNRIDLFQKFSNKEISYTVKILAVTIFGTFYFRKTYPATANILQSIREFLSSHDCKEYKILRRKNEDTILLKDAISKDHRYYLAYGSNLCISQMKKRCPNAVAIGTAYLDNYKLAFRRERRPCLTLDEFRGGKVPVAVWEVTPEDEDELDFFEGYPVSYEKFEREVKLLETGKSVQGFYYIMNGDQVFGKPAQTYWKRCVKGYNDFHFNLKYLEEALDYATKHLGEL